MLLPTPTPDEVLRFQGLYKEQYGADLPAPEALTLLTRLVQFYYLTGGHDARRQRLRQQVPPDHNAPATSRASLVRRSTGSTSSAR